MMIATRHLHRARSSGEACLRLLIFAVAVFVMASGFSLLLPMAHAETQPAKPDVTALEAVLAKQLPTDGAGIAALIAQDGKLLYSHGYGLADREKKTPVTPDTRFRIGSVTKQFTAAAILHLAQDGKLSIDDPLSTFFPDYPGGDRISLRQLLNHTSGLAGYTGKAEFMSRVTTPIMPEALVAWFKDDKPAFEPGKKFAYCNTGYFLLGVIVQKVSGLTLGDYLHKHFFAPLGMRNTGTYRNSAPPDNEAKGYTFSNNDAVPAINWDMSWAGGAGDLYSTVGDLWLWTEALHGGRVLKPESLKQMLAEVVVPDDDSPAMRYGMGLYHDAVCGIPAIGHNGGLDGFLSEVRWLPQEKVTIVVLGNAVPPKRGASTGEVTPVLARAFLGPEIAARAPKVDPSVDPKTYADFVGRYDYGTGIQHISVENGHIYGQLTGQARFEIFPSGPNAFFYKITEASMKFRRDEAGVVTAVDHTQNGATFTAKRLSEKEWPILSNEALDAFTGKYRYGPFSLLTVTRKENQLYAQLTGQAAYPIFARGERSFVWKVVEAEVSFIAGPDGKTTDAKHTQNGTTFTAPRLEDK